MLRKLFLLVLISLLCVTAAVAQGMSSPTASVTSTSGATKRPPFFHATKDQIKEVQTILKEKKLYDGDASGTLTDETRDGIKSFQKDNGLKETGTLNRATLEKFGVTLTDSQKAIPVSPASYASATSDTPTSKSTTTTPKSTSPTATATSGDAPKKAPPFRANSDQIRAAQKILIDGKMYTGEQTGKLDDATRDGLRKYQEANKMKITGTLNAATLEKMGIALTDAQKANAAAATTTTPK
jgi:peptidoglycan hydrolase-like protein with peptidoglycan-binding domain